MDSVNNGLVFGAVFDENMAVKHIAVQSVEGLGRLRGSKYFRVVCFLCRSKRFFGKGKISAFYRDSMPN